MKKLFLISVLLFSCFQSAILTAEEPFPARVSLVSEEEAFQPGRTSTVAVRFEMEEGWHTYWKNPGAVGTPIEIKWNLPAGFSVSDVQWPYPKKEESALGSNYVFEGDLWLLVEVTPPSDLPESGESELKASVSCLVCSEGMCVPVDQEVSLVLQHSKSVPNPSNRWKDHFEKAKSLLPTALENLETISFQKGIVGIEVLDSKDCLFAYFCPDQGGVIDEQKPVALDGKTYYVPLASQVKENTLLSGTLVLKGKSETKAFNVTIPIAFDGEIAMVDRALLSAAQSADHSVGGGVLWALIFAFLGGVILNAMPCVLPVITLKIFNFAKMAGHSRKALLTHALFYTLGVLLSFWALATLLIVLKSYGHAVGWGFQLQEPLFVAVLIALLFVFALSLFGVVEIGTGVAAWAGQADSKKEGKNGVWGAIFSGVLATAVATPCTGPFLGTAVGFAATLPPIGALAIFSSLGLGLASPYILISAFPKLQSFLPKPGAWMVTFKELLGFCMLATSLWLVWVFGAQTGFMGMSLLLFALFFMAVSCWAYGKWATPVRKYRVRWVGRFAALTIFVLGMALLVFSTKLSPDTYAEEDQLIALADTSLHDRSWIPFSPELVEQYRQEGRPVLIDFTAKWCLTCQANHLVLTSDSVEKKLKELGVVTMKADWTRKNPMITKELEKFKRNSVPLYVLYTGGSDNSPEILPQLLTPGIVLGALDQID